MGVASDKPNLEVTVHLANATAKKVRLDDAPIRTRPSNGKAVVEVKASDRIVAFTAPWEKPSLIRNSASKKAPPPKKDAPKPKPDQLAMDMADQKKPAKKTTKKKTAAKKTTAKKTAAKKTTAQKTAQRKPPAKKKPTPKKKS